MQCSGSPCRVLPDFPTDKRHLYQASASIDNSVVPMLDPTYQEAKRASGIVSLACMPAMSSATNISFSGSASRSTVKSVRRAQSTSS